MATNKDARILCAIFQKIYENHRERSPPLDIFGRTIRIKKMKEKAMEFLKNKNKPQAILHNREALRLETAPIKTKAEKLAALKALREGKSAANIIAAANQVGGLRRSRRTRRRRRHRRRRRTRQRGGKYHTPSFRYDAHGWISEASAIRPWGEMNVD